MGLITVSGTTVHITDNGAIDLPVSERQFGNIELLPTKPIKVNSSLITEMKPFKLYDGTIFHDLILLIMKNMMGIIVPSTFNPGNEPVFIDFHIEGYPPILDGNVCISGNTTFAWIIDKPALVVSTSINIYDETTNTLIAGPLSINSPTIINLGIPGICNVPDIHTWRIEATDVDSNVFSHRHTVSWGSGTVDNDGFFIIDNDGNNITTY